MPPVEGSLEQAILQAAEECVVRYGIAKTTMEDVARGAGVSRATVYRYFDGRDALIEALIRRRSLEHSQEIRAELANERSFGDQLVEGILAGVRVGIQDPLIHAVSTDPVSGSAAIGRPGLYAELVYEKWEPIFLQARNNGELRSDIDLEDLADWLARLQVMFVSQLLESENLEETVRRRVNTFVVPSIVVDLSDD